MSLREIEGGASDVSCIIHESSPKSNRYCSQSGLSHPPHAFSWAAPSLDSMQANQSTNLQIGGRSEINPAPRFVHDLRDILQMPSFSRGSITSDSDFLPITPGVAAPVVGDLSTSPTKLSSSSRKVRFDDYVKELIPGLDLVSRADGLNLFQRQDSINFVADAFMPKKDGGIRWSHALSSRLADMAMDCACSEDNLSYPTSSLEVSKSELVDDWRLCNSREQNISFSTASSSFVPAQPAAAAASVMFPSSDAMLNRGSGTLASVESVMAPESVTMTQDLRAEAPIVAKFSQLHGRQEESGGTNPPTEKGASGDPDLGIRVAGAEIGHGASNATNSRYNQDARGGDGNVMARTTGCGEVEGVPVFCDPVGMFSVAPPGMFAPIMAGFPHAQAAYPPAPLDQASMREMNYRAAAFRPTAHIGIEAISRPKRKNVKISKDPQSVAARHRRERISDRIRILQRLVPGGTKMDTASMLDEAIHYVKFLKTQVQAMQSLGGNGLGQSNWSSIWGVLPGSALHSGASGCFEFGAANMYACSDALPPRSIAQSAGDKGSCSTSFPCLGQLPLPDQFQVQQSCH